MACVALWGYDFINTNALLNQLPGWSTQGNSGGSSQTGRLSGLCWRAQQNTVGQVLTLPSTYATLFIGFAFRLSAVGTQRTIIQINTAAGASITGTFGIAATGKLICNSVQGSTTLATNTWYYIELKYFINGASSTVDVRLNGATEIATQTLNLGSTNIGQVQYNGGFTGSNWDYDDGYVFDTSGSVNNTWAGDSRVTAQMPTAEGNTIQLTPSTGTDNSALVDETSAPNDDTDYNSSSTANDKDTYVVADLGAGSTTVNAVQVTHRAKKTDAGPRAIATVIRQGGTDYVNGTEKQLSIDYSFLAQLYDLDPLGSAWTASSVNNDEFGVKLTT